MDREMTWMLKRKYARMVARRALSPLTFISSQGHELHYYVDCCRLLSDPTYLQDIARALLLKVDISEPVILAGVELGGALLVSAMLAVVEPIRDGDSVKYSTGIFVRKDQAERANRGVEGIAPRDYSGQVILVDDVSTTGSSLLKAAQRIREVMPNARVEKALVVLDRESGAAEVLASQGIKLSWLITLSPVIDKFKSLKRRLWV